MQEFWKGGGQCFQKFWASKMLLARLCIADGDLEPKSPAAGGKWGTGGKLSPQPLGKFWLLFVKYYACWLSFSIKFINKLFLDYLKIFIIFINYKKVNSGLVQQITKNSIKTRFCGEFLYFFDQKGRREARPNAPPP